MTEAQAAGRPVVLVTQGTVATDPENLIRPAVTALAGGDALVITTTVGHDPDVVFPPAERPVNLRVEAFLPFMEVFPHVDVVVTNGGYGGVQTALACGVPLVVAGTTEDKKEVSARVEWSIAGVALHTDQPTPAAVGQAVERVLGDMCFCAAAVRLQASLERFKGAPRAAAVIAGTARRTIVPGPRAEALPSHAG